MISANRYQEILLAVLNGNTIPVPTNRDETILIACLKNFGGGSGTGNDGISPTITVKVNTDDEYVLTIKDKNGAFDTPNLKGSRSDTDDFIKPENLKQGENIVIETDTDNKTITISAPLENFYNIAQIDRKLLSKAESKDVGDINNLAVVGTTNVIEALNKLNLSFMQSLTYNVKDGKKVLTITYKNGIIKDIDITAIITATNIGELANVDDTSVTDGQALVWDAAENKYKPITIDSSNILQDAKAYTDSKINTINNAEGKVVDAKPTYADGTITYVEGGETKTTADTNIWFYYPDGTGNYAQTIFIGGVEVTIAVSGSVNLVDYVNKTTGVTSTYNGTESDKSLVANLSALDALIAIVNNKLSKKVNTSDVVNDLNHTDTDKPLSANMGRNLKELVNDKIASISGSSVVLKRYFKNVEIGKSYNFDSPISLGDACIVNVYKIEAQSTNLTDTLKEFSNNTKQDFIKNEDEIIINDDGISVLSCHSNNATLNSDGYYESKLIDKSEYSDLIRLEVM